MDTELKLNTRNIQHKVHNIFRRVVHLLLSAIVLIHVTAGNFPVSKHAWNCVQSGKRERGVSGEGGGREGGRVREK